MNRWDIYQNELPFSYQNKQLDKDHEWNLLIQKYQQQILSQLNNNTHKELSDRHIL